MPERVVQFGPGNRAVGVLTAPEGAPARADRPVVVILNAGIVYRIGPNRLHVRLARRLAGAGLTVFRFDLSGIGDSEPRADASADSDDVAADIRDALQFLEETTGARSFVLVGLCSGAYHAQRIAVTDRRIVGTVLLNGYMVRTALFHVRRALERAARLESWTNILTGKNRFGRMLRGQFKEPASDGLPADDYGTVRPTRAQLQKDLEALVARDVAMLFVFSGKEDCNASVQFREAFPLLRAGSLLRVVPMLEADHSFTLDVHRRALIDLVVEWATDHGFAASRTTTAPTAIAS